jgi:predicted RNA binding protein YcfA (HicA-like mRNA interferase family)
MASAASLAAPPPGHAPGAAVGIAAVAAARTHRRCAQHVPNTKITSVKSGFLGARLLEAARVSFRERIADPALGTLAASRGGLSQGPPTVGSMPPLPRITGRELVRALGKLGWVVVAQKGSHAQLKHPSRGGRVTVPLHAGETIGPGLLRSILSQAGITVEELRAVL